MKPSLQSLDEKDYKKLAETMKQLIEEEFKRVNFDEFKTRVTVMIEEHGKVLRESIEIYKQRLSLIEDKIKKMEKALEGNPSYIG